MSAIASGFNLGTAAIAPGAGIDGNAISGVESFPRWACGTFTVGLGASGTARFVYWTQAMTRTISTLVTASGGTAAAATPTLCRIGLYAVAPNGDLTLVARCASDTAMYAGTQTEYARALATAGGYPASYTLLAGQRYAGAVLVTSGTTMPTLTGTAGLTALISRAPKIAAAKTGETDLAASYTDASLVSSGSLFYMAGV